MKKDKKLESRKKFAKRIFDFIKDKELKWLLQRDYKSAKVCLKNNLCKPCIILYTSIIEAILIEILKKFPRVKTFADALEEAERRRSFQKKIIIKYTLLEI